ncbi:CxxC-x17-CxxC domain-containing protein [Methanosarcina thermophila]|jgi:CxxC-x17-CxxC domain-containing protein|uniref:CxxC-x17-CxxC domain-containing protein n=3 Tax=Methanosarcina thermophila TaxID=2210 RepID=A0A1I6Y4B3_METTE|nr:CxxC-x17-CxxC domain-containing protein [Methanosarcina thermophila]ALK05856.1 MAG: hypothetical protein AAY43_09315 [Methanosarcina sp. 795]AKB12625.1 hypothetical protein MSTHT_0867 [Methanosarcina thermophila TM-1]AKB16722.1 hypothetical protein MSTHC_2404 [Methanosarcina thermophila CHTI-55]NLU57657.1 hypothetical protein [Methanosarcina thermophila]SFT45081.1 CxxC-x17-CxxC domain-containing protein [Methanosarcina thermophila]
MVFNNRNPFRGRDSNRGGFGGLREMHNATCSDCGSETQVPFRPDPDRPVYCRECLPNHRKPRENRY